MTTVTASSADMPAPALGLSADGEQAGSSNADLARLASVSCAAPFGAVSVFDTDGSWIQAAYGFNPETPLPVGPLCERVMLERGLVVVADVQHDAASAGISEGAVRSFAGAPIMTEAGELLGVLWVADPQPRPDFDAHLGQLLVALANNVAMGAELRGTGRQYEAALDLVRGAAFRCGPEGVLEWVSPSWTTVTGHPAATAVGRPLSQFLLGDIDDALNDVIAGVGDESVRRMQCSLLPVEGSGVPVELVMTRFSRDGSGVSGVVGVLTDVRERQQRELEARHDHKLESLGRLSAGIAHEINTPIQFVGDNTRFLASSYQQMLDLLLVYRECVNSPAEESSWDQRTERVRDAEDKADIDYLASEVPVAVAQTLEGIERVAALVRAMKSFSYKDSNDRSYTDLNAALKTTLTVAQNELKYVADVTLDLGELPDVLCHVGDLNQVFLNLLVNAADAMVGRDERGELRIATRTEGPLVVITFADNGCGIPESIQHVVFEPFFTTKEVGKGTGQGLALARAVVVDKYGGTIEVRSEAGEGTEFVLRLPIDGKRQDSA